MSRRHSLLAFTLAALTAGIAACDTTGVIRQDFPIDVTEVQVPDTITTADSVLPVRLFGLIGQNRCFSLLRIDDSWPESNEAFIVAYGRYEIRDQACQEGLVHLDETVELRPANGVAFPMSELTIRVARQDPEPPIVRTVQVVEPTD
jgi:hypothetical protein